MKYPAHMHVYQAKDGWRWRLKAQNGNVIADSGQHYVSRRNATTAVRMVAVRNANNFRALANSSEAYTNRQDCLDAITQLFGATSNVYLRQAEQGNQLLRLAVQP